MQLYFVRIGSLAEVHAAQGPASIEHNCRVVIRTTAGLQLGQVLGPCTDPPNPTADPPKILRATTSEDELLIRRLNRHKNKAVAKCRAALAESGSQSVLLDVDQILDGGTLLMHFLGAVDPVAESITKTIADQYESVVQTRHFAKLLRDGCGPDCGSGAGCATGSCSGCSAAVACKPNAS